MKQLEDIRLWYRPIQPVVKQLPDHIVYNEIPPHGLLKNLIHSYWEIRTLQRLEHNYDYRIVSDGCIDIFYNVDAPGENYIMGVANSFEIFPMGNAFHYVGIRFLPGAFPLLFGISSAEFTDRVTPLRLVLPALAGLIETAISETRDLACTGMLFDEFMLKLPPPHERLRDDRLYEALTLMIKSGGSLRVEQDLHTGLSERQLRRLFEFYVGDSPKKFMRIVRFQHALGLTGNRRQLRVEKNFIDAGYYDQAHFIKDFRQYYGLTPSSAITE